MKQIQNLWLGDCLELMKDIPDKSIDAIICDPPYGTLNKGNASATWDKVIPLEPMWREYERVIKDNGAIIMFGQGMFTARLMLSNPKLWRYNLVWDKCRTTGFLNVRRMPLRCHEDICVFYKSLPTYNPQMEALNGRERNHSRGKGVHKFTNTCYGNFSEIVCRETKEENKEKKFPRSIIKIAKEHGSRTYHPTQKSVKLLRYLIRTYTNEGDMVLDNCMGSGSLCVAAAMERRRFIGIELNEEYYKIAVERVARVLEQPTLF